MCPQATGGHYPPRTWAKPVQRAGPRAAEGSGRVGLDDRRPGQHHEVGRGGTPAGSGGERGRLASPRARDLAYRRSAVRPRTTHSRCHLTGAVLRRVMDAARPPRRQRPGRSPTSGDGAATDARRHRHAARTPRMHDRARPRAEVQPRSGGPRTVDVPCSREAASARSATGAVLHIAESDEHGDHRDPAQGADPASRKPAWVRWTALRATVDPRAAPRRPRTRADFTRNTPHAVTEVRCNAAGRNPLRGEAATHD